MTQDDTTHRRVTATDIARSLGVSRATVGFVLNNTPGQTISEATRRRVLEEAERLGYRPSFAAQALASGRTRLVLFVLPDWPLEYSMRRHLEEASLVLDEAGYSTVTYTRHATDRTRPLWESLEPDVVIGLTPLSDQDVASMRAAGITRIIPDPDDRTSFEDLPGVGEGPRLQVQHLSDLGHRRLGIALSPDPRIELLVDGRARAAAEAASRLGLPEPLVHAVDHRDGTAERALRQWRDAGVTGIVAYNDDIAAVVAGSAVRAGLSVPGDLAVVGHDDTPLASVFVPALSSISIDNEGLGRFVAELALARIEGRPLPQQSRASRATLVRRETT